MTDDPARALIAEHVRHLVGTMGLEDIQLDCEAGASGVLRISIMAGESGKMLIGTQGANLNALQHVIRCMLRKHVDETMHIVVDVNGYRIRRERNLLGFAEETARRAQRTGKSVELSPMNAVDRRTIHTALALHKDVVTESTGDGSTRRVVIRPVFL